MRSEVRTEHQPQGLRGVVLTQVVGGVVAVAVVGQVVGLAGGGGGERV